MAEHNSGDEAFEPMAVDAVAAAGGAVDAADGAGPAVSGEAPAEVLARVPALQTEEAATASRSWWQEEPWWEQTR